MARVDQAVGRILVQYDKFGLLTGHSKHTVTPLPTASDEKVVQQTAEKAATLLQNTGNTLPLSQASLSSLALIGPGAGQLIATDGGGEKSGGLIDQQTSPLAALKQAAPNAKVTYSVGDDMTGTPVPASALSHNGQPGLVRTTGTRRRSTRPLNFTHSNHAALPAGQATSWAGTLTVPTAGTYWLNAQTLGATLNLTVDGKSLITTGAGFSPAPRYGNVHVTDGNGPLADHRQPRQRAGGGGPHGRSAQHLAGVRARRVGSPGRGPAELGDTGAAGRQHERGGHGRRQGQDGRGLRLGGRRDRSVQAAGRRTGRADLGRRRGQPQHRGGAELQPADRDAVAEQGQVRARDVVPGRQGWPGHRRTCCSARSTRVGTCRSPGPPRLDQELAHQSAHPERTSNGVDPSTGQACGPPARNDTTCVTTYSEGVDVGYRYYLATDETPLYPFGYGLSYTSFRYSGLQASTAGDGGVNVSFQVTNKGTVAGTAVPQVYLGAPDTPVAGVSFAPKALAGFDRVVLAAGQTTTVSVHVPVRSLQYWSDRRWLDGRDRRAPAHRRAGRDHDGGATPHHGPQRQQQPDPRHRRLTSEPDGESEPAVAPGAAAGSASPGTRGWRESLVG